ncbi:hypothetical protein A3K73_06880 [Candidatus Pacearchaeota archaeon RBG_13_36_9]|nr:MAG: hypothetical protein A3K73_06880 [Candidatus Pacearchaeota archaeon RBG_13_36_9]
MLAPILSFGLIILLGYLTPSYNPVSDYISEIWGVGSRFEVIALVFLVLIGFLFLLFSIGIYLAIDDDKFSYYNFLLLAVFSVSLIFLGIFPCYGECTGNGLTLHLFFTILACSSLGFSPLLLFFVTYKDKEWKSFEKNNLIFFFFSAVFLILYGFFYNDYKGFFQRAYFFTCFLWVERLSIKLFKLSNIRKAVKKRKK